jgi:hypothetical protein
MRASTGYRETTSRCVSAVGAARTKTEADPSHSSQQARAEYADYYKNSLLYLACVNVETDLLPQQRYERAHDLAVAALLGKIYNFGELVGARRSDWTVELELTRLFPHS